MGQECSNLNQGYYTSTYNIPLPPPPPPPPTEATRKESTRATPKEGHSAKSEVKSHPTSHADSTPQAVKHTSVIVPNPTAHLAVVPAADPYTAPTTALTYTSPTVAPSYHRPVCSASLCHPPSGEYGYNWWEFGYSQAPPIEQRSAPSQIASAELALTDMEESTKSTTIFPAQSDDGQTTLHKVRFVPAPRISADDLFRVGLEEWRDHSNPGKTRHPARRYCLKHLGLTSSVDPRSWLLSANPLRSNLSLKLFVPSGWTQGAHSKEIREMTDFLRAFYILDIQTRRHRPWDLTIEAIAMFLLKHSYFESTERPVLGYYRKKSSNQAATCTRFVESAWAQTTFYYTEGRLPRPTDIDAMFVSCASDTYTSEAWSPFPSPPAPKQIKLPAQRNNDRKRVDNNPKSRSNIMGNCKKHSLCIQYNVNPSCSRTVDLATNCCTIINKDGKSAQYAHECAVMSKGQLCRQKHRGVDHQ